MFITTRFSRVITALLLTAALVGSWAVCAFGCEERSEHHFENITEHHRANETNRLTSPEKEENCPIISPVVVIQERPTIGISASPSDVRAAAPFRTPDFALASIVRIRQHPPSEHSFVPLFVRLCSFRI